jgi:hypothetical protein
VTPRWSRATLIWIAVLSLMASFQLWRGAWVDGVLFAALVLMLVIDRLTNGRIVIIRRAADASRVVVLGVATILGVILVIAPRHGVVEAVAMAVAGTLSLVLAWSPTGRRPERPARAYRRTAVTWSILGVALCVWEAAAYIASVTFASDDFPTISVLLDPVVSVTAGRVVFTALWIGAGLSLLRAWDKR